MPLYENLSKELTERMVCERAEGRGNKLAFDEKGVVRRKDNSHDYATVWRPAFVRDCDKILNCPFYNRYADKTQVFSFYRNDDITRRGQHVQYVSRIARTIGAALRLNLDLIEAIALGHDIGHTPFGHAGERYLDELYCEGTGRRFCHNVHSVRVLDKIFPLNVSLQTLQGISAHNGEMAQSVYAPLPMNDFNTFDNQIEACYRDNNAVKKLVPSTLEGCVVRVSDIIAYIGKDRQDAEKIKLLDNNAFETGTIGKINSEMVNNLTVNLIENSYGKPYIKLDDAHFSALQKAKEDDYRAIYFNEEVDKILEDSVRPAMALIYKKLLSDLEIGLRSSPIFRHHIDYLNNSYYKRETPYEETEKNQIVVDYIASMTDDYFVDLYDYLFPDGKIKITFKSYFA